MLLTSSGRNRLRLKLEISFFFKFVLCPLRFIESEFFVLKKT